jgi:hypothetical protein
MYAQWRNVEDYQAMRENPAPLPYLQQALAIAKFDPGMYEVVDTYSGSASEILNPSIAGRPASMAGPDVRLENRTGDPGRFIRPTVRP